MTEQIYAQQMGIIAGEKALNDSIFKGDPTPLVETLDQKGIAPEETVSLLSAMNYGMHREEEKMPQFTFVQERLAGHVMGSNEISKAQKMHFSEWIVESGVLLGGEMTYLDEKLAQTKNNFLENLEPSLEVTKSKAA